MTATLPVDQAALAALAARIEEASLNAWPALQQQLYHGWVLRFSRGFTRRANSVQVGPTTDRSAPLDDSLIERVRYCENRYAAEDLATVFRLTSLQPQDDLETLLHQRGYRRAGETLVMACRLPEPSAPTEDPVASPRRGRQLASVEDWLAIYASLAGLPPEGAALHRAILRGIPGQLGLWVSDGAPGPAPACELASSCGLAVHEAELVGLFDIITAPARRRQGHGRAVVDALLRWGLSQGASYGYLQVTADNDTAQGLYERVGFRPLYRYWYRHSS
jgi:GNAT superfamily N-acetyltransferase